MSWSIVLHKKIAPRYSNQPFIRVEQLAPSKPVLQYHTQGTIPEAFMIIVRKIDSIRTVQCKHAPYTGRECLDCYNVAETTEIVSSEINMKIFASENTSSHQINMIFSPSLSTSRICFLSVCLKCSKVLIFSILQEIKGGF